MLVSLVCSLLTAGVAQTAPIQAEVEFKLAALRAEKVDLQSALANHPDVQIAEAELRMAQAKLTKVKLLVAQQVTTVQTRLAQARERVEATERNLKQVSGRNGKGEVPAGDLNWATQVVATAKAELAVIEAEARTVLGTTQPAPGSRPEVDSVSPQVPRSTTVDRPPLPHNPAAEKLAESLDKGITLDQKGPVHVDEAFAVVFRAAGLDGVTVRLPSWAEKPYWGMKPDVVPVVPGLVGANTVVGWAEFIADSVKERVAGLPNLGSFPKDSAGPHDLFVREYGLLFADVRQAPPGAETLAAFARRAAKTAASQTGVSAELRKKVQELLGRVVKLEAVEATAQSQLDKLAAGTGLTIQYPMADRDSRQPMPGGEKTVAAWLDQFRDTWAHGLSNAGSFQFYVREYGLILCFANDAPPGAVPLNAVK